MNRAAKIREFKQANPTATPQEIATALGEKVQYIHTTLHKAKVRDTTTIEERQLVKGQQILRDEINNLHRQITRLKLHNEMLQSMLKVQEFDLMHGHGSAI